MKKKLLSFASLLLAACICVFGLPATASAANSRQGQTVILYTANLRGDIRVLPQVAQLKADYEAEGAEVILADAGNYLQGTVYSTYDSGETVVSLLDTAGYDVVAVGSHEFDFGTGIIGVEEHGVLHQDGTFGQFFNDAAFAGVSANLMVTKDGTTVTVYSANTSITTAGGLEIGFFGICDPNTEHQVLESSLSGLSFADPAETAAAQRQALSGCDLTVCLSNAGTLSEDAADIVIDIGSGDGLAVGAVVLGPDGKVLSSDPVDLSGVGEDAGVAAAVNAYQAEVDAAYPAGSVAKNSVILNGAEKAVRSGETNLGDLWTDALLWFAREGGIANYYDPDAVAAGNDRIQVDADHIVALWNGGNLRDYLHTGDVVMKDLERVLPYPNRVAVVYLTGSQLLEMLEAATQGLPYSDMSNASCAAFLQAAGLKYSVDTSKTYDAGEPYRTHWAKANSINRVSISEVNGKPFDSNAMYAVITSNMIYNGMDSNYICAEKDTEYSTITSAMVRDVVWMYLQQELGGVIGGEYAQPQARISIISSGSDSDGDEENSEVPGGARPEGGEGAPKTGDGIAVPALLVLAALSLLPLAAAVRRKIR